MLVYVYMHIFYYFSIYWSYTSLSGRSWVRIPWPHHTKGVKNGTRSSLADAHIKRGSARKIE